MSKFMLVFLLLTGIQAAAQLPNVTIRFANPYLNAVTQTYCLDVEFQCDTPGRQLQSVDVRFYYDDNVLEFEALGDFQDGYAPYTTPVVNTLPAYTGPDFFGFVGAAERVIGGVQLAGTSSIYLSTTGWTKLFNVCFHVDDPTALNGDFCPSVVWDLKLDPANGGFLGTSGVVAVLVPYAAANRNVIQFNWEYNDPPPSFLGEFPFGYPIITTCASAKEAPTTKVLSACVDSDDYVTFPFIVSNFVDISSFSLTVDYDPAVLEYCCAVPHSAIATNFDTTLIYPGRIQMTSDGFNTSLDDETTIFYATFKYLGGASTIAWCDNGGSCQYIDAITNMPLPDEPTSNYYFDGTVENGQYIWAGIASSAWDSAANWLEGFVPGAYDDVIVNATPLPTFWPSFDGDFTLGNQCKTLTLNGNAQMSITGDLTIGPGTALTITDDGEIFVGGNWANSGTFDPGMGAVTFNGTGNGSIVDGVPPENFVSGFIYSTFPAGMTAISGGSNGPTGDNTHSDVPIGFTFNYLGVTYTTVRINANGWLSLNLSGANAISNDNCRLFTSMAPTTALAAWWDDLLPDASSSIRYITTGTAPNRVFTVEWKNILSFNTGSSSRLNFQIKLYESSNIIEFCYGNVTAGTHNIHEGASIGIKDATGGQGNFMEAHTGTTKMMVGCLKSNNNWPAVNYRFTPPVENTVEEFHHITVSKDSGELHIVRDVIITGVQ